MENKKLTVKRLIIFYVLALLPLIGISAGLTAAFGEPAFVSENSDVLRWVGFLGVLGMFAPSAAHIITRIATKEGWKNCRLGLTLQKGNYKYFAFAIFYKLAEGALFIFIIWQAFLGDKNFSEAFAAEYPITNIALIMSQLAFSVILFFPAFGEEWGWRGYMMPKLLELMPKPAAIVVGGILWGLWHAPLTVIGHNFGVDYAGFPFVGIGLMCVFCIIANAVLTFFTERTKSIYPASFCHMINNNLSPFIMAAILFSPEAYEEMNERMTAASPLAAFLIYMAVSLIAAVICFMLFIKKEKN